MQIIVVFFVQVCFFYKNEWGEYMYRIAIEKLFKWKERKRRKPLIIEGARQVGKTWLMKEFGKQAYADTVYINFDSNSRMADLLLLIWM